MREILFRGKRKDTGEWVRGCFGQHTSLDAFIIDRPYPTAAGDWSALGFYEVEPNTVGQYTGLSDKNGKRIFEGDILDFQINIKMKIRGKVIFARGGFQFESPGFEEEYGGSVNFDSDVIAFSSSCLEVIGNIYDNPDLLLD